MHRKTSSEYSDERRQNNRMLYNTNRANKRTQNFNQYRKPYYSNGNT